MIKLEAHMSMYHSPGEEELLLPLIVCVKVYANVGL
jgi:hypothetical protein